MTGKKLSVVGLFAGVGGIEFGFKKAGFDILLANELDKHAAETYHENHQHRLVVGDIAELESDQLPKRYNVLTGGFPCQPFSVAGYRKGFGDERGNVYWHIERLFRETRPDVVFLENVKNLVNHDDGKTFRTIKASLETHGYSVLAKVLNAKDYGNIPQNRERIYVVAFRSPNVAARFEWPKSARLTKSVESLVDFDEKVDDRYYYDHNRPFYDLLRESITDRGIVYQWRRKYVRANKSGDCPTLTANMGMGGHNVPLILSRHGIRKLTPAECFALMGFPKMKFPTSMADSHLYKQAGNAVVVPVVTAIAKNIRRALEGG